MERIRIKNTKGLEKGLTWAVIAAALALRLLHLFFTMRFNPLAGDPRLDAAVYDLWARSLASGGGEGTTALMQSPLYPWFLSAAYRLFGAGPVPVRLIQALLGTASCGLVIFITRRCMRSVAASIIAGAAAALYAPLIFYEGLLLPTTLVVFLDLLFIAALSAGRHPTGTARLLVSGVLLGMCVAAKAVALLLLPGVLLHIFLAPRPEGREPPIRSGHSGRTRMQGRLKAAAVLVAGLAISLVPVTVRNAALSGEFIPLTTGGGINFYIGNNAGSNGFYSVPFYEGRSIGGTPEEQLEKMNGIASEESGKRLSPGDVSAFWLRKGLEQALDDPGRWARLIWWKFLFFWNAYERANVESLSFHRRFTGVLGLPLLTFGLIAPLGLIGIFMTKDRWRSLWLLYGGVLAYLTAALVFYVLARYRLPAVPFLLPFAGAGAVALYRMAARRAAAELVLHAAAIIILYMFMNAPVARDTPGVAAGNFVRLGGIYAARGETGKALEAFRDALELDPANGAARRGIEALAGPGGRSE